MTNLTAADFEVRDEGRAQAISLFQTVSVDAAAAPAAGPVAARRYAFSTNTGAERRPRPGLRAVLRRRPPHPGRRRPGQGGAHPVPGARAAGRRSRVAGRPRDGAALARADAGRAARADPHRGRPARPLPARPVVRSDERLRGVSHQRLQRRTGGGPGRSPLAERQGQRPRARQPGDQPGLPAAEPRRPDRHHPAGHPDARGHPLPAGRRPQHRDAAGARADHRRPHRGARPQGGDDADAGVHRRSGARRSEARDRRGAPGQRRGLLRRRARAGREHPLLAGAADRPRPRFARRRRRQRRDHARRGRRRRGRGEHRRLLGPQPERPRPRPAADRRRVARLLPARLPAGQGRQGRRLPAARGEGDAARRHGAGATRLLRRRLRVRRAGRGRRHAAAVQRRRRRHRPRRGIALRARRHPAARRRSRLRRGERRFGGGDAGGGGRPARLRVRERGRQAVRRARPAGAHHRARHERHRALRAQGRDVVPRGDALRAGLLASAVAGVPPEAGTLPGESRGARRQQRPDRQRHPRLRRCRR